MSGDAAVDPGDVADIISATESKMQTIGVFNMQGDRTNSIQKGKQVPVVAGFSFQLCRRNDFSLSSLASPELRPRIASLEAATR